MSHIVKGTSMCTDRALIGAACKRRKLADPVEGSHSLFSGQATGTAVRLPGWNYPVVIDPKTGNLQYDNYNGAWGKTEELDAFKQAYAVEKHIKTARAAGYGFQETALADGSVKLEMLVEA